LLAKHGFFKDAGKENWSAHDCELINNKLPAKADSKMLEAVRNVVDTNCGKAVKPPSEVAAAQDAAPKEQEKKVAGAAAAQDAAPKEYNEKVAGTDGGQDTAPTQSEDDKAEEAADAASGAPPKLKAGVEKKVVNATDAASETPVKSKDEAPKIGKKAAGAADSTSDTPSNDKENAVQLKKELTDDEDKIKQLSDTKENPFSADVKAKLNSAGMNTADDDIAAASKSPGDHKAKHAKGIDEEDSQAPKEDEDKNEKDEDQDAIPSDDQAKDAGTRKTDKVKDAAKKETDTGKKDGSQIHHATGSGKSTKQQMSDPLLMLTAPFSNVLTHTVHVDNFTPGSSE